MGAYSNKMTSKHIVDGL